MVSHSQSSEEVNIDNTETPNVRGITRGKGTYDLWKRTKNTLKVTVDAGFKRFVGENASKFISELGVHLKAEAPVAGITGWSHIDKSLKESIIRSALEKFEIEGGLDDKVVTLIDKACRRLYTNWKSKAKIHYDETLKAGLNPYEFPYPTMKTNDRYKYMIDHVWNSDKFKKRSETNKINQSKVKYNHTMGSRSYAAALYFEDKDEVSNDVDLIEFFKKSHHNEKTGKWVDQQCKEDFMELKKQWNEAKNAGIDISMEELFQQVLGRKFSFFSKKLSADSQDVNKQDNEEIQRLKEKLEDLTKSSEERFEIQQKIIEEQNKKMEEYRRAQFEFMRSVLIYTPQSANGNFPSMTNILNGET